MRIFSIIVACLALVACVTCVSVVSKFRVMYENLGATLPNLATTFLNTSGWIPGGIFLILAILLFAVVAAKQPRIAGFVAVATLLFVIGTALVLPAVLMTPLSQVIRDVEASKGNNAKQGGSDRSTTALESKAEGKGKSKPNSEGRSR